MTLYLKYRPQRIDDLDLKVVRDSLTSILSKEEIPHAFLFAGPKGTGKTSAARILAKAINCEKQVASSKKQEGVEPCNECSTCSSITRGENLDVIEIDAASHRGIDDIRMLREAVKLAPVSAAKKVYIIDEAHMLTAEACNALLKVLEEPPSHVVFILATTNPEKLIDTIRSRTTLVQFTKATIDDVVHRLKKVSEGEGVTVDDAVLSLVAKGADGAFRDGVKLFEQLIAENIEMTHESVAEFLFGKKSFDPEQFLTVLVDGNTKTALDLIEDGCAKGVSAKQMAKGILDTLRTELMQVVRGQKSEVRGEGNQEKMPNDKWPMLNKEARIAELLSLIELFSKAYAKISSAYLEQLPLEIASIKYIEQRTKDREQEEIINAKLPMPNGGQREPIHETKGGEVGKGVEERPKKDEAAQAEEKIEDSRLKIRDEETQSNKSQITNLSSTKEGKVVEVEKVGEVVEKEEKREPLKRTADTVVPNAVFSEEIWAKVLTEVHPRNTSTEALLRASKPLMFDGKTLTVGVYYKFHKERLETRPHRDLLEEILEVLMGIPVKVTCELTDPPAKSVAAEAAQDVVLTETKSDDKIVDIAKEIFGS